MMIGNIIMDKCRMCILSMKIKKFRKNEMFYKKKLMERSQIYHKGKLNIDNIVNDMTKEDRLEIYSLKREIVKNKMDNE